MTVLLPYRFTLFSNLKTTKHKYSKFYYLIDLHYSQTCTLLQRLYLLFYYLIDLHYSQTLSRSVAQLSWFYYLIDLHYSQTRTMQTMRKSTFYYLIDLHYSQTLRFTNMPWSKFYYLIDLHYSQTSNLKLGIKCTHYTVHGKSMRLFYNICIMIVNKIRTNHYQSQQVFRIQKLLSALSFQC